MSARRELEQLVRVVEQHYDAWVQETPTLGDGVPQIVLFTRTAQRLANDGVGLTVLLTQLLRTYGLEARDIEITDERGGLLAGAHEPATTLH